MDRKDIGNLYDNDLARRWDQRLLKEKHRVAFEVKVIGRLLESVDCWLDASCGSGYFLSQFPDKRRAGFDVSPSMVNVAKETSPDAEFIRVHDYRDEVPEWAGQWGLVSNMWQAYNYVNTVAELERVISNFANWTADEGFCFVPFGAPLGKKPPIPYERPAHTVWGGKVFQPAVIWSWWDEDAGKLHKDLVEPHPDYMRIMFSEHFNVVEFIEYPKEGHRAVIATHKKHGHSSGKTGAIVKKILKDLGK